MANTNTQGMWAITPRQEVVAAAAYPTGEKDGWDNQIWKAVSFDGMTNYPLSLGTNIFETERQAYQYLLEKFGKDQTRLKGQLAKIRRKLSKLPK